MAAKRLYAKPHCFPETMRLCARRYDFFLQSPLLGATRLEAEFDWGGTHIWVSTCVVEVCLALFTTPQRNTSRV